MGKKLVEYAGHLNGEVRLQLLDLVELMSQMNLAGRNDIKRLCNIAIELLDNAQRYGSADTVAFHWQITGRSLVVSITNHANRTDAERLLRIVDGINAMTAAEILVAYRAQLTNAEFGEKGGAGLGMLQIAKRTGSHIKATVEELNKQEFLCTSVVVALFS